MFLILATSWHLVKSTLLRTIFLSGQKLDIFIRCAAVYLRNPSLATETTFDTCSRLTTLFS